MVFQARWEFARARRLAARAGLVWLMAALAVLLAGCGGGASASPIGSGGSQGHSFDWADAQGNHLAVALTGVIDPAAVGPGQAAAVETGECGTLSTACKAVDAVFKVRAVKGFFDSTPSISALGDNGQGYSSTAGNISTSCRGDSFGIGIVLRTGQSATFCVSFIVPKTVSLKQVTWHSSGVPATLSWRVS